MPARHDRFLRNAEVIVTAGRSYRLRGPRRQGPTRRAPARSGWSRTALCQPLPTRGCRPE